MCPVGTSMCQTRPYDFIGSPTTFTSHTPVSRRGGPCSSDAEKLWSELSLCPPGACMCHRGRLGWPGTSGLTQNRSTSTDLWHIDTQVGVHISMHFIYFPKRGPGGPRRGRPGPRRGPKRPSAKPKDVWGAFRGPQGRPEPQNRHFRKYHEI